VPAGGSLAVAATLSGEPTAGGSASAASPSGQPAGAAFTALSRQVEQLRPVSGCALCCSDAEPCSPSCFTPCCLHLLSTSCPADSFLRGEAFNQERSGASGKGGAASISMAANGGDGGRSGGAGAGAGGGGACERSGEESDAGEEEGYAALIPKEKANFGLSGALMEDEKTGNVYKGIQLKWSEPADAAAPSRRWQLHVFKKDKQLVKPLHIHRQSAYLVGRERRVVDIPVDHPSCSSQHAVFQFRRVPVKSRTGAGVMGASVSAVK
jgi:hypothetical protein